MASPVFTMAASKAELVMQKNDKNGDGRISAREWRKKKSTFRKIDGNADGFLSLEELKARFGDGMMKAKTTPASTPMPERTALLKGEVSKDQIDAETLCGITRARTNCSIKVAIKLGMFETGLRPKFPKRLKCRDIDEQWAISYTHKRPRENYHGGIDMPAPYGTPMLAVARGTVVGLFSGADNPRGFEIVLRHSPKDTGLPMWVYTQYTHFQTLPEFKLGAPVKMGQILGTTGNSGISTRTGVQSTRRRPAIHFGVLFTDSDKFANTGKAVVPLMGRWMDPNALYRQKAPFDSGSMKALPRDQKKISIPVITNKGKYIPANTKLIWPYSCDGG